MIIRPEDDLIYRYPLAIRSALPQSVVDLNESPLEESSAFELAPEVPQVLSPSCGLIYSLVMPPL